MISKEHLAPETWLINLGMHGPGYSTGGSEDKTESRLFFVFSQTSHLKQKERKNPNQTNKQEGGGQKKRGGEESEKNKVKVTAPFNKMTNKTLAK